VLPLLPPSIIRLLDALILATALLITASTLLRLDAADGDIDLRRHGETERLADLGEVELVDVEDLLERV